MVGKNQSYVRQINRKAIIKSLMEENYSATMLAKKLSLSNASLSTILSGLVKDGYIRNVETPEKVVTSGRPPVYYTFNWDCGCLMAIVLADYYATIVISDMSLNIMDKETIRVTKYDLSMICDLVFKAKQMMQNEKYKDTPLISINFAVSGRVNSVTGELQLSPQFDESIFSEGDSIANLFKKQFGVPFSISNDINLAGQGELSFGLLRGFADGLLVYADEGIGGALVLNGKLYTGSQGFSGEIGRMHGDFRGEVQAIDEFVSLRVIKQTLSEKFNKKLHTSDVIELYHTNNEVKEYINETARCLGKTLKDIVELLDIPRIVLSGRVSMFGNEYLSILNEEVAVSINGAKVVASELGKDAIFYGALQKAVREFVDRIE